MTKLYHPDLDRTIEVSERAARVHREKGWIDVEGSASDGSPSPPVIPAESSDTEGTNVDQAQAPGDEDEEKEELDG